MFHLPMTKSAGVSRAKLSNRYLHKKLSTPECHLTNSNGLNLTLNVFSFLVMIYVGYIETPNDVTFNFCFFFLIFTFLRVLLFFRRTTDRRLFQHWLITTSVINLIFGEQAITKVTFIPSSQKTRPDEMISKCHQLSTKYWTFPKSCVLSEYKYKYTAEMNVGNGLNVTTIFHSFHSRISKKTYLLFKNLQRRYNVNFQTHR